MAASNQYLDRYNKIRNGLAAKFTDPAKKTAALSRFDSDPRAQSLRKAAGLAPLSTRQGDVKAVARQSLQQAGTDLGKNSTAAQGFSAGLSHIGLLGIPEMIAAAGERFLPSAITGNNTDASYSNILQMIRARDDRIIADHPIAATAGAIGGTVVGGRALGGAVSKVAGSSVPVLARAARTAQKLTTLEKGKKLTNFAKIAAIGGAAGGTQAAGTGEDIGTGLAEGAIAAPVVTGAAKVLIPGLARAGQVLASPFGDFLKLPNAARVLSKITNATTDQIQAELVKIKAANPNANPTLFELLPLSDRNRIMNQIASKNDNLAEQTGQAITARTKQLAPEMQSRVSQILQPNRQAIHNGLVDDLATARGGELKPEDTNIAAKAMNSTTDMDSFRKIEADAYMEPHNGKIVGSLNDILPSTQAPDGTRLDVDPELSHAIRAVAGSARSVPEKPLTVSRVVDMIHSLKKPGPTIDPNVAADAELHLQNVLRNVDPDVAQSAQQMNNAYAARSRMLEGMSAGSDTKLRDTIDTSTRAKSSRLVRNAYDTPEGNSGRALGQGNTIISDLEKGPGPALRLTNDIAGTNNDIGRELVQNLGPDAQPIIAAAQGTAQNGQALGSALNKISGGGDEPITPVQAVIQSAAALHPTSFVATKFKAWQFLKSSFGLSENRARTIIDMVFSQDPAMQERAINALGNQSNGAKFAKYLSGITGALSADSGSPTIEQTTTFPPTQIDPYAGIAAPAPQEEGAPSSDPYADIATPASAPQTDSPYASMLQQSYANENPDLVDLVQRVKHQESRGNQSAVSKKGAVGVMQIMPGTAPEAAKLAGVKWEPDAYKNDPAYNELLGHAYLSHLLVKYGGNVAHALAAYNAGPGKTDEAIASHGDNFLSVLPAETQDYVARVG